MIITSRLTTVLGIAGMISIVSGTRADSESLVDFQAESSVLGSDWVVSSSVSPPVTNITITSNSTGNNPGSDMRLATYTVAFPSAGVYELYARICVGGGGYDDDSMFYGNGFGARSPTTDSDWVLVNGLAGVGFSNSTDVVTGGGALGSGMWKWINLSQYTVQPAFTVTSENLTQTFQIGAREDGLGLDKFAFGLAGYGFTVADLDAGGPGTPPSPEVATIDWTTTYQTIECFGGAIAFYNGWFRAHPYKEEIYSNAFAGLNISMLRLGNWFRYQGNSNFDLDAKEFVEKADSYLGRPVPIYMSSWAPPAFLKSNGQVGNGGTLIYTNGGFAYNEFAQYWHDSLLAYEAIGVKPTWISIQNEPDWEASYDSCIFRPTEGLYNGTNYASYSKALDAVYLKLTNLPSPPKLLAPEVVHIRYSTLANYAATMNASSFYGVAYHLYGDSTDGTIDGYIGSLRSSTNYFPGKPRFMTEYGVSNMVDSAALMHHSLTEGLVSGYNYWSLIWPWDGLGLVQIEFPWDQSSWTNAPPGTPTQSHGWWLSPAYWSMKHFSYYIQPGYQRVSATSSDPNVLSSAYLSPDGLRLVTVLINRGSGASSTLALDTSSFPSNTSRVYQTTDTNHWQALGAVGPELILPARSLTTVVLDRHLDVGQAFSPSPAQKETDVVHSATLSWSPGSNAVMHAVYLGFSSNAVAQATPASSEFQAVVATNSFAPVMLSGETTYFWRVDEIAGVNTNKGLVWSFTTRPLPELVHRYSFDEGSGSVVADSEGGPAWNGSLPNGGSFAAGHLTLDPGSQQHASLPPGIVSTLSDFTIEAWVRPNVVADWSRLFDFGNGTTVNMFLTPQNGITSRVRYAITTSGAGGEQQINCDASMSAGVWYHVAVAQNGTTGTLYLNGVPVGTNGNMTLRPSSLGSTANNYLGRSQYSNDAYLNATLDEFRIYSVALSAAEIAATHALGPDQVLSSASPPLSMEAAPGTLTLTWPLESADFTVQTRTDLIQGDWVNVPSAVPQIIGNQWRVVLPVSLTTPQTFYRLSK